MTIIDILLIATLLAFVAAWWLRAIPRRPRVLAGLAAFALGLGVWGVIDDRWQDGVGAVVAAIALLVLGVSRLRKAPAKQGLPFVSGTVFVVLAAVAVAAIVLFPVWPLPKPSGPNAVGVRSFEVTDPSRPGLFKVAPTAPRRLLVRVWYPAGDVSGQKPARYFSEQEADTTAKTPGALVGFPPFFTFVKHVRTNSYPDAPLLRGASPLPVLFYSHGYTSYLTQNTALMEELASHGYVVFSVQHTYDSAATAYPNGDVAAADPELFKQPAETQESRAAADKAQAQAIAGKTLDDRLNGYLTMRELALAAGDSRLFKSGVVWAADRIFLHDQLQKGAVPPAIRDIAAAGDLTRVGEMGMSFGGATSGTVCMVDRRCAAGINLDGGDFPFQAFGAEMPVPFLMFHSDLGRLYGALGVKPPPNRMRSFNEFSYEGFATAGTRPDIYRVMLKDAHHLGLSDSSLFMRRPVRDIVLGTTPTAVMIGAQNDFVRGFFDRHLRGQANGFPQKELASYRDWVTPVGVDAVKPWWLAKSEAERAALTARIERARKAP
jgi:predicted dienelactone hydrolase